MKGLSVRNIQKEYENKPLLSGISIDVFPGETVCLLGASGSGKSTLLRIIAGLEKPEAGVIYWNDTDITEVPTYKREFGFMFQDYALFPHMNVEKNIEFGIQGSGGKEDNGKQVKDILGRFNLTGYGSRKVTDLSGGEQQRVALARTLASNPRLLLLDEPLAALDRSLRKQLLQEIREVLHQTGTPAIYVTHDQEEAFSIADRLLILEGGVFLQNGTPEEVYLHPVSLEVANFFGLTNQVSGKIIIQDSGVNVETQIGKFILDIGRVQPDVSIPAEEIYLLLRRASVLEKHEAISTHNTFNAIVKDVYFGEDGYRTTVVAGEIQMDFLLEVSHPKGEMLQLFIDPFDISIVQEQAPIVRN
jgi:ABC-type Fe3+/spermidine/putrescine transport system ATPase subunit